jgi:2-amino-4-hydroxy-6-hydroxymethyldihydropteridine diphosphokinase
VKNAHTVHIALGSNLGDRLENLARAQEMMSRFMEFTAISSVYETPPWGVLEQPRFLNQVVRGRTSLLPLCLLNRLKKIEKSMGRVKTVRFGPRVIDLDILLYGERTINTPYLQVPHPRMQERAFVMVPLAEISPGLVVPREERLVQEILAQLDQEGIRKL